MLVPLPFAFCLLLFVSSLASGQATPAAEPAPAAVKVAARAEPNKVTIGTPFRYTVEITAPEEVELVVPLLGDRFGDFHVTDFGEVPPHDQNGSVITARWFTLVAYSAGDLLVPPFPIKYRLPGEELRDAESEEVLVIAESLLAKDPKATDIRDIAPPEAVPRDWRPLAFIAGVLVALVALGAGLYFLLNRRRAGVATPLPAAHEVALEALRRLRARRLLESGEQEGFYVGLTDIVRTYVENRFGVRAPEMTTEEFLATIQRDRRLTPDHRSLLGAFLTESDLVKFARHRPQHEDAERAFAAAQRFVQESRLGPGPEEMKRAAA